MRARFPVLWFAKFGLSALGLLLACGLATAWFGNALQLPSTTTRDGTLITMNRYVKEPVPDVVLVGSSLTFRLKEEYFATPTLRNLALAGGSPVTGLEIVASQPRLPKIIIVEINILSRAADTAMVDKYSGSRSAAALFLRPIRTAIAAYENWNHAPRTHAQTSVALAQLLAQPPGEFDNRIYVERALQQENAADPAVAVQTNARKTEELIAKVEQRGARVLLFEIPLSAQLEESRSARITREIVRASFPDRDRWLRADFTRSQLRWADGVHLDERSAVIIAQSIDRALSSLPKPK